MSGSATVTWINLNADKYDTAQELYEAGLEMSKEIDYRESVYPETFYEHWFLSTALVAKGQPVPDHKCKPIPVAGSGVDMCKMCGKVMWRKLHKATKEKGSK